MVVPLGLGLLTVSSVVWSLISRRSLWLSFPGCAMIDSEGWIAYRRLCKPLLSPRCRPRTQVDAGACGLGVPCRQAAELARPSAVRSSPVWRLASGASSARQAKSRGGFDGVPERHENYWRFWHVVSAASAQLRGLCTTHLLCEFRVPCAHRRLPRGVALSRTIVAP